MSQPTIEDLIARESQLTWSFGGFAAAWAAGYAWPMFMAPLFEQRKVGIVLIWLALLLVQLLLRGWYAYAAAMAARALGSTPWPYAAWIMLAPLISLVPIPLVDIAIAASPLSIKFLLGNQLQTAIRDRGSAAWHEAPDEPPAVPIGRLEPRP